MLQHEGLPRFPSWHWMSCPAKWCVCFSWQTAVLCQSAIKFLARCASSTHICSHVCIYTKFITHASDVHVSIDVFMHAYVCVLCVSSRIQATSFMQTFTQTQWAQRRLCLLMSGGREGTSRYTWHTPCQWYVFPVFTLYGHFKQLALFVLRWRKSASSQTNGPNPRLQQPIIHLQRRKWPVGWARR